MSFYWDKEAEADHVSVFKSESDKSNPLNSIQTSNSSLLNNIDVVYETIVLMEKKLAELDGMDMLIVHLNNEAFNGSSYFAKAVNGYSDNFYLDIKKMKEFLEFSKSLGGDTTYFKFKTN
jgi:hypothetical protein